MKLRVCALTCYKVPKMEEGHKDGGAIKKMMLSPDYEDS